MNSSEQQIAASVLVIGTGGSGLRAAIELADPATVQVVTEGAAESIRDLERYGMAFARETGRPNFTTFLVWVRHEDHSTGVEGLYAIGEASSGLHGANRLGGNSLIELLVYGKIVGRAAARYSAGLNAQQRSRAAVSAARDEIREILSVNGPENVRFLQRALRNAMTEHAGVVRDEDGLRSGLGELAQVEERLAHVGVHPDIAGFYDLAHAFDLKASAIAARATVESALERRETRGCHNRSDFPDLDEALNVNLVWSGPGRIEREAIAGIPQDISTRMREVSANGKLVE